MRKAKTLINLLVAIPLLFGYIPPATPSEKATTWPESEAGSFDELGNDAAVLPEVQVPESESIEEACKTHFETRSQRIAADNLYDPKIHEQAQRVKRGEITEEEFQKIVKPWHLETVRTDRRELAAEVGVLRAAGYEDWKMYSRYSLKGVGDLWRSNIIAGEKVADNESHQDFKYTFKAFWYGDVTAMCERYYTE